MGFQRVFIPLLPLLTGSSLHPLTSCAPRADRLARVLPKCTRRKQIRCPFFTNLPLALLIKHSTLSAASHCSSPFSRCFFSEWRLKIWGVIQPCYFPLHRSVMDRTDWTSSLSLCLSPLAISFGASGANRRSWDYILRSLTVRVPSRITPRQTGPVRAKFRTGDSTLAPSGTEAHFLTGVTDGTARLSVWMKCVFYGDSTRLFISQAWKMSENRKTVS